MEAAHRARLLSYGESGAIAMTVAETEREIIGAAMHAGDSATPCPVQGVGKALRTNALPGKVE